MASEYSDNFNRTDGALTTPWSVVRNSGLAISSNQILESSGTNQGNMYNDAMSSDDHYVEVKATAYGTSGTRDVYIMARSGSGVTRANCYTQDANYGDGSSILYRFASGSPAQIGSTVTGQTFSAGDTIRIEVENVSGNPVITMKKNGTQYSQITDSSGSKLTTGKYGGIDCIRMYLDDYDSGTLGAAGSTSPSLSPSLSPSKSPSLSPSQSPSISASPSLSPSQSPSVSESPSLSPSISPSASPPAGKTYTRGDYVALPSDDTDLETAFTGQDYVDVETDDNNCVSQTATEEYPIFEFKDQNVKSTDRITPTWKGKSNLAPSTYPVVLQIYNRTLGGWETLDTNNTSDADTEFTLDGFINADLSDYYDGSSIISCRVLQDITDYGGGM